MEVASYTVTDRWLAESRALSHGWGEPYWVTRQRLAAWEAFRALAIPGPPDEEWRRVQLTGLDLERYRVDQPAVTHAEITEQAVARGIILADWPTAFQKYGSEIERWLLMDLTAAPEHKLAALQSAAWNGGFFLHVPPNVAAETFVRWRSVAADERAADLPLYAVVVEAGAAVTLVIEEHAPAAALRVGRLVLVIRDGAKVRLVRLIKNGPAAWGLATETAHLGRDAGLEWGTFCTGGRLTKIHQRVRLEEAGARANLYGMVVGRGREWIDLQTRQDHLAPHTTSDLLYKGTLKDQARSVFRGVIRLEHAAQQSDAYQANHNLLLSDRARADSIPVLEILANDVRCKHGATVGSVDPEQVFYVMSRGLSREAAVRLIVEGFFAPILDRFPVEVAARVRDEIL